MKKGAASVLSLLAGGAAGSIAASAAVSKKLNKKVKTETGFAQKHLKIMEVFNQWLSVRQEGRSLVSFFEDYEYKTVAVYGMSFLGERLVQELKDSNIEVKYAIDKNADNIYTEDVEVKDLSDDLPEVDVIVVTAVYFFDEIEEELCDLVNYPVISLEDVVYGV